MIVGWEVSLSMHSVEVCWCWSLIFCVEEVRIQIPNHQKTHRHHHHPDRILSDRKRLLGQARFSQIDLS